MPHDDRKSVPALLTLTEMADAVKATNADQYPKKIVATPWVRPSDWPALPIPSGAYAAGLFGVYDTPSNFVALVAAGDYSVDWGDGSALENFTGGTQANHQFDYSAPGLGPLVSDGFKTAIIVVTPQNGNSLTSFDLTVSNSVSPVFYLAPWLDVALNAPDLTSFAINADGNVNTSLLAQIHLYDSGLITDFSNVFSFTPGLKSVIFGKTAVITSAASMFSFCYALEYVSLFDTSNVTDFSRMFSECHSLKIAPSFDVSSGLTLVGMFEQCFSLIFAPEYNSSSCLDFSDMFNNCSALKSVSFIDTSLGQDFTFMFGGCSVLESVPLFDLSSATILTSMFQNCNTLVTIPFFDTSSATTFDSMFNTCFSLNRLPELNTSQGTSFNIMFVSVQSLFKATFIGTRFTIDYSAQNLPVDELISILNNLGTASGSPGDQTVIIVGNWGNDGSDPLLEAIASAVAKGWAVGA